MTKKVQKILLIIFLSALIVALMATSFLYASTYGRYSGGALSDDSTYDDSIEFVGAEQFVVYTPEELIEAIENGYSYIQIADNAESPFVITTGVQDVSTNLVLDLNGTVVVRNSRNPMLDVGQGVSIVLVYDSSEEQTGAFYNPVGSALQVSGGTMTVGSGSYESGPRDGENNIATGISSSITLYTREGVTEPAAVARAADDEYVRTTAAEQVPYINGNYYQETGALSGYSFVTEDTFLVYTEEVGTIADAADAADSEENIAEGDLLVDDRKLTVPCNVASCDFYYYYPIATNADGTETYAVVYGYWDVKELAENGSSLRDSGLQWPYASIRMDAGQGFVRGGTFDNHFGLDYTYGIFTQGGTLTVSGTPATTKFSAVDNGICIDCAGGGLLISGGEFASDMGDTIRMQNGDLDVNGGTFSVGLGYIFHITGGEMDVTAGSFTKNAAGGATGEGANNGAAIYMAAGTQSTDAGTLRIDGSAQENDTKSVRFMVTGSYVKGIEADGGTVTAEDASFEFNEGSTGTNNTGVLSEGGQVALTSCTFTMPGENNRGIASQIEEGEGVTGENEYDTSVTDSTFTIEGKNNRGVYVSGGRTSISGSTLTVGGTGTNESNFGIEAAGGTINAANAIINVYGSSSAGIHTYGTSPLLNITGTFNCTVTQETGATLSSAAIMATSGRVTFETDSGTITSNGVGIVVRGGTLAQNSGALTVNTQRGTGIYIASGDFDQTAGTLSVVSNIAHQSENAGNPDYNAITGYRWADFITDDGENSTPTEITNGIYVTGGSLTANGTLDVTHTGVKNDKTQIENNNSVAAFTEFEITSFAIRVQGAASTRVTINAGSITNAIGGGVNVSGGDVFLGNQNSNEFSITTEGDTEGDWVSWPGGAGNWSNRVNVTGGHAVDVQDGTLTIYDGTYSAAKGEGVLVRNGTVTIEDGTFSGQDGELHAGPAASYALKMYGGTAKISGGSFGGGGSGAFITGTAADEVAEANITGGTFNVSGQGGFSVFEYANVTFDPIDGEISVIGASAGLILEGVNQRANGTTVTIRGGTFESTATSGGTSEFGNALWNGNRLATLEISGGSFDGLYAAFSIPYGVQAGGSVTISGGTFTGDRRGISFEGELNVTHAAVISGGTFEGGDYGIYYGVDGENANDGLLIEGGTFRGTGTGSYGFFFADNPWSDGDWGWPVTNNVAIIGGTFSGRSRAIGTADTDDCRRIRVSDVFVEHTGQMRFGYNEEYDVNWWNDDPYKTPINTGDYVFNDDYGAPGTDFTLHIYDPNNPNIS